MTKRVLVTGATGFIGRSVMPLLSGHGCTVTTLGRADAHSGAGAVVQRIVDFAPDVVVNLATHFLSTHSPEDIPSLIRANVEWGTLVTEGTAAAGARLVSIGTAWQHLDGDDYNPVSLYAATKQALSVIDEYYVRVRGLEASTVTLFDTYGPLDPRPKLVPLLLNAVHTGAPLEMSDGDQLIDLTYVDDVARGIVSVALTPEASDDYVLRTWNPIPIRAVVATLEASLGVSVPVVWNARPPRDREMREDWVFGRSPAGWRPEVSLAEGFRRTWAAFTGSLS